MTLPDARRLARRLRDAGISCTVPLGWGPTGYWVSVRMRGRTDAKLYDQDVSDSVVAWLRGQAKAGTA